MLFSNLFVIFCFHSDSLGLTPEYMLCARIRIRIHYVILSHYTKRILIVSESWINFKRQLNFLISGLKFELPIRLVSIYHEIIKKFGMIIRSFDSNFKFDQENLYFRNLQQKSFMERFLSFDRRLLLLG